MLGSERDRALGNALRIPGSLSWYLLNRAGWGLGRGPGGAEVELLGAGADEAAERRHLVGLGDAVVEVGVEADAELLGGGGQGLEGVPGAHAVLGARAEADVPLAHAPPRPLLGRVVVEPDLG